MLYSYSFANRKRDLSDILSTVIKDEPRFISNFKPVADARSCRHEWLEDQTQPRSILADRAECGIILVSAANTATVKAGTLLVYEKSPALFRVAEKSPEGNALRLELVSANGSDLSEKTLPSCGGRFLILPEPLPENPVSQKEENISNFNFTQLFYRQIVLPGAALAQSNLGSADNQLNRQTAFALAELARDLNRTALYGRRIAKNEIGKREAGGLYYFGTGTNSLCIDAKGRKIDSQMLNDAAQQIIGNGFEPTQILCSPAQARVISGEYRDNLQILRSDDRRGAYVAVLVNEINGRGMTLMADPDMPDGEAWVMDVSGFGFAFLGGQGFTDEDISRGVFDGIRRLAQGELTFEFRNCQQRCCRIKNLMESKEALQDTAAENKALLPAAILKMQNMLKSVLDDCAICRNFQYPGDCSLKTQIEEVLAELPAQKEGK